GSVFYNIKMKKITIIGAGNLGIALAEGICSNGIIACENLTVTRNQLDKISFLAERGIQVSNNNLQAIESSDLIILAVKPYKVLEILEEIKPGLRSSQIIVSVATGISIESMQEIIGSEIPIYRA